MTKETKLCKLGLRLYNAWETGIKGQDPSPLWKEYSKHVDTCKICKWHLHIGIKEKVKNQQH